MIRTLAETIAGLVLVCIVLTGLPIGLTVWVFCALFVRSRPVPLADRRVRRVQRVLKFRLIPASQAACCCQACGWVSAN